MGWWGYLGEELLQAAGGHPSAAAPVMAGDPEGASGMHEGCEQHLLRLRPHKRQGPRNGGKSKNKLMLL